MNENLPGRFTAWADQVLAAHSGEDAIAYNFNLYEHAGSFAVQLVGTTAFDPESQDWACQELFSSGEDLFELPHALVGGHWTQGLETAKTLIAAYLQRGLHAARLTTSRAVGVGFVDGDLEVVHKRPDA